MKSYFFRKNETVFYIWCKKCVKQSYTYVEYYEKNYDKYWFKGSREEYFESVKIIRQYEVLKASLTLPEQDYLERYLVGNESHEWERHDYCLNEIYANWLEICFPKGRPQIKKIDALSLGKALKLLRIERNMSISKVAGILEISEATLRSYENGRAMIKADTLYGLSQIYKLKMDEIVNIIKCR